MNELNSQLEQLDGAADGSRLAGRRRFVRGVGVVVPAVLTVGTRSALAQGGCLSPSASASINLLHSRPDRPGGICTGRTPGYWQNAANNFGILWARDTLFGSVFNTVNGEFPNKTIEQVIRENGSQDPQQLGAHLGAAWCNLQMGWVNVFSVATLKAMWDGRNLGYYPVAGATTPVWYAADIVTYLKTTMT